MNKPIILDDTGWIRTQDFSKTVQWYRRIGFISMHCYRTRGGPHHRFEAYIIAEPFGAIRREFKSQASPKRFCEKIISKMIWRLKDLNKRRSSVGL